MKPRVMRVLLVGVCTVLFGACSLFTSASPSIEVLNHSTLAAACAAPTSNANACALDRFLTGFCDGQIVLPMNVPGGATLICTELDYPLTPAMAARIGP
jgi:hypothetical protein